MNVGIDASKVVITKLKLDKDRKVRVSFCSSAPSPFNVQSRTSAELEGRLRAMNLTTTTCGRRIAGSAGAQEGCQRGEG